MDQCNAQTNRTLSSAVSDKSTARLSKPCTTTKEHPPSHTTLRGLDLLKSCAKFYENDLGVATPTVRQSLDAAFNQPAISQVSRSRHSKRGISTVAVTCLFLLLLASVGVATIMWGGFVIEPAQEPGLTVGISSAAAAQLPAPAITALLDLNSAAPTTQTPSNNQSDIIIHKVKTQPITVDAEKGSGAR